ncbi:MAG: hypothetical protein HUK09_08055, partial [Bacteroidaceae bacterium]|nr:hypothetical protein [Bacteroidaceae bacterium]
LATLLIAHSGLLVLRVAAARIKWLNTEFKQLSAIAALVLLLASWQSLMGLQIASIAGGGFRELMGIFFLSLGVLLRKIDSSEAFPALQNPIVGIAAGAIIVLPLAIFYPVAMTPTASIGQVWALAAGGCASFLLLRGLSSLLAPLPPKATQPFVFAGQYFFPILVFHLLAFKLVSLIKVAALGLPWDYVAQHPVVHTHPDAYFWVFYTLVGFGLPLGLCWSWHTLDEKYHLRQATPQEWLQLSIMCGKFLVRSLIAGAVLLYQFAVIGARAIFRGIIAFGRGIKNMVLSIIRASSPNDDDE